LSEEKSTLSLDYIHTRDGSVGQKILELNAQEQALRAEAKALITQADPHAETNDKDYVFINFIIHHLPKGIIGLLLAVIFSAAMSSTSAELNALATTSVIDIYKRNIRSDRSSAHYVNASMVATLIWGLLAILFATFGTLFENLIQLVNIIGSIFYGTILGVFLVAFYIRRIGGDAVFYAALIAEAIVLSMYFSVEIGFLWFNVIGCAGVVIFGLLIQMVLDRRSGHMAEKA